MVGGHTLLGGEVRTAGGGLVTVVHIAGGGDDAHQGQGHQREDGLLAEAHIVPFAVDQLCPADHRHQIPQEHGQDHGLDGEHGDVLEDTGHGHHAQDLLLGLVGVADVGIVPGVDELLHHHIHQEADDEAADHDTAGIGSGPVEAQGVGHGAGDLGEHEGQEIVTGGIDQEAHGIGDHGGRDRNHRSEDHGAQGGGQHGGLDAQLGAQRDRQGLQGHTQGDHQGGDDQHLGILQLRGGVTPVGLGERMGVQGSALDFGHKNILLFFLSDSRCGSLPRVP